MPTYPGVYVDEISGGSPPIPGVPTSITAFVGSARLGPIDDAVAINSFADFDRAFGGLWLESNLGFAVRDFFLNGGTQAVVVRVNHSDAAEVFEGDFIGAEKEAANQGLYALKMVDQFNLVCIPPYNSQGNVDNTVVAAGAKFCEDHRAFLLVDPPSEWTTTELAKSGIEALGIASKNAALFFPRLRASNPIRNNQIEEFAPSGAVAGVFARTDSQHGVWKTPAGVEATLNGIAGLSVQFTEQDLGELNVVGVNCLRTLPNGRSVVWGSRTLDRQASEWRYVAIRRLAFFVEESLDRGTQWVVLEPNDEPLWVRIRQSVGEFLHRLFQQGAFQGARPSDAYFVKCDRTTMTQVDIDEGVVRIVVGFAPQKPAEFVVIAIQQRTGSQA